MLDNDMLNTTASSTTSIPSKGVTTTMDTESMESAQGFLFMVQRLPDWITIDILWKVSTILLLLLNLKVFPFVYHLRILNGVRFCFDHNGQKSPFNLSIFFNHL